MISGDWTEVLIIDEAASPAQREALETTCAARGAGPWAVLARFVGRWLDTRDLPIEVADEGTTKTCAHRRLLRRRRHRLSGAATD